MESLQMKQLSGRWIKITGSLRQISVGSKQYIYGVSSNCNIFYAVGGNNFWNQLAGALSWVSVGIDGTIWGVGSNGNIYRKVNDTWIQVIGELTQISVGNAENIWGVNSNEEIYQWIGSSWNPVKGALCNISVGADGTVWGVNSQGDIYRRENDQWIQIPGSLTQLSVGNAENVWGVNSEGNVYRWTGDKWQQMNGTLSNISVAADGSVWGVNSVGEVFFFLSGEPLLVFEPAQEESKPEHSEEATCKFFVGNTCPKVQMKNIVLRLEHGMEFFKSKGITISNAPILDRDLDHGNFKKATFVISAMNATVGSYAIHRMNGSYQMEMIDSTINIDSTGGWMNFQVESD